MADHEIDNLIVKIDSEAGNAGDGIAKLEDSISRLKNDVAQAAPELDSFMQKMRQFRSETQPFSESNAKSGYAKTAADVRNLSSELHKMAVAEKTAAQIETERMQNDIRLNNELAKPFSANKGSNRLNDSAQMAAEMAKAQQASVPLIESLERMDALYKEIDARVQSGVMSDKAFSDSNGWNREKTLGVTESMLKEADALGIARQEIFDYANSLYSIYSAEENASRGAESFQESTETVKQSAASMFASAEESRNAVDAWTTAYAEASEAIDRFGNKNEKVEFQKATFATGDEGIAALNALRDEMLARQENTQAVKEETKAVSDLNAEKSVKVGGNGTTAAMAEAKAAIDSVTEKQKESADAQRDVTNEVKKTKKEMDKTTSSTKKAHKATSSWLGNFAKLVKRIVVSRLIRTLVNNMLQGAKEGLENIVHYSEEANAAMSTLATGTNYLKNSFAALATPILTLIAPAFDLIVDKIVDVSNAIAEFIASLNGSETFTKALKQPINYMEQLDKSTKDVVKSQRELIGGFDELNIFSSKGSNSSKDGDVKDYSKMFETAKVKSKVTFATLGESLARELNTIPWADLGYAFGQKLSGIVNGGIEQFNAFVSTFDFGSIGSFVGNFINGIEWGDFTKNLAESVIGLFTGAIDLAAGLFETVEWDEVTKKLLEGVKGAVSALWDNKEKIAQSIARFLGDALAAVGKITVTVVQELGDWIIDNINTTINYFKDEIEECGGDVGRGILKGISDATDNLGDWLDKNFFTPLVSSFKEQAGISGDTSKLTQSLGKATGRGLIIGLGFELGFIPGLVASAIFLISDIMDGSALENLKNVGYAIGNAIKTGFFEVLDMIIETANSVLYYINPDWVITKPQFLQDYLYERDHPTTTQGYRTRPRNVTGVGKSVKRNSTEQSADMYYDLVASAASAQANGDGSMEEVTEAWDGYVEKIVAAIEDNRTVLGDEEIARSAARGGRTEQKRTGSNIFA